jgi:hypothetical protein
MTNNDVRSNTPILLGVIGLLVVIIAMLAFILITGGEADEEDDLTEDDVRRIVQEELAGAQPAGLANDPLGTAEPADEVVASPVQVVVNLANGTAGGSVPDSLELRLRSFSQNGEAFYEAFATATGGPVTFEDVPQLPGGFVAITAPYQAVNFSTVIAQEELSGPVAESTLTLYEPTSDPSVVQLERVWYLADAVTEEQLSQYFNWYFITNTSDRVYVGDPATGSVLRIPLPVASQAVSLQQGSAPGARIDSSVTPPAIVDTQPLVPGESRQILADYLIAYPGEVTVSHQLPYPADEVVIYTNDERRLAFEGANFTPTGVEAIEGLGDYVSYTWENVPAGTTFTFTLRDTEQTP